ncbi:MAG: DUF1080 domain-containing protein [Phycisphaerales bacterium]|jgi:hypothetical protein|nr:DUF1080 domain-containing protein [Phycisphaerales bacterium]
MMSGLVLLLGGLLADPLPGAGAVMRVWQVESGLSALAPLVPGQAPNAWMRIDTIDLEGSRGDFLPFTDDFLALIDGSFLIEMPGEYAFRLSSDDGSQLWIGGSMVINHDGLHGAEAKTGVATLTTGAHPFQVKFFEHLGGEKLLLEWRPPGATQFALVPKSAMRSEWPAKREIESGVKRVAPAFEEKQEVGPEPSGPHNTLSDAQIADGWALLFDGEQASAWRGYRKRDLPAGWVVKGGILVREGGGDIITREQFDDFDLYVDWKVEKGGNSGIFFNGGEEGGAIWETAPEMQILDNLGHANGLTALQSAGANYGLHAPPVDSSRVAGKWNRARIRVQGDHVQYWLNGVKTADYVLGSEDWKARVAGSKFTNMPMYGTKSKGHIGLQDHGDPVSFRNIRIRRLDAQLGS